MKNIEQDLIADIHEEFKRLHIKYRKAGPLDDVLFDYLTVQKKRIAEMPRNIHFSKEIHSKIDAHALKDNFFLIMEKARRGDDLNPYQSDKLFQLHFHDHMLYEWGIHHLHIGKEKNNGYFYKRTNSLVFVLIKKADLYFLDIDTHREHVFAEEKWLHIIYNNWPHLLETWQVKGVSGLSRETSAADRQLLRSHGINNGMIAIDGKVYAGPGFGIATSGHSAEARMWANNVWHWLYDVEKQLDANGINYSDLKAKITATGIDLIHKPTGKVLVHFP